MEQLQDKIRNWLDNEPKDHFEGIGLLSQLTTNRMMIRNLSRNETAYKRDKLIYELQKQLKYLPSITTPTAIEATDPGLEDPLPANDMVPPPVDLAGGGSTDADLRTCPPADPATVEFPPLPAVPVNQPPVDINPEDALAAEQLEIAYSRMYNKKGMLINGLREFKENENEARKAVLEQIGSISRAMDAIKLKLNYFKQYGKLPVVEEIKPGNQPLASHGIPDDPVAMQKLLLNERSTISKIKRKLKEGNMNPEKLKALEALQLQKTELVNEIERRLHG